MTKSITLLLSLGIAVMIIFSGCAPSPAEAPSASEDYSEPPAAAETPGPSLQPPNPSPTPDGSEAPVSYEPELPVGDSLSMGRIEVRVTDAPPREEVTGILVTVAEGSVEVHRAVAEQEQEQIGEGEQNQNQEQQQEQQGEGEWLPLAILEGANQFDLLQIKGLEEILAVGELEAGKYTQIRIDVVSVEVKFGEDEEYQPADLSGGQLKFVRPFDVVADETTVLLLDFDAAKSVNVTGQGRVQVKPVVKLTIQQGKPHELASVEGTITEVDLESETVTIVPDGETEAIVLDIIPQTEIELDDAAAALEDLAGIAEGNHVTADYYLDSLKTVAIEVRSP